MCTSLSTSWQRRSWPDIRDRTQFSKEKESLCNTVYSAVIGKFSQETAKGALEKIEAFKGKLTHVKELGARVSKISKALSRVGFIDLERKEPKWRDPYNLELKKAPSDALYHLLSKAKEEDIAKALEYLRRPLKLITSPDSTFILKGRVTVHLPRSTFRFFHDGLRGIFPRALENSKPLDNGKFSVVTFVNIGEDSQFAYKRPNTQQCSIEFLYKESLALMRLKHKSIIPIEAIDGGGIYLPKADGDLLKIPTHLSDNMLKPCFQSIAKALSYVHGLGMKHGDLKAANILFKKDASGCSEVFICDFGLVAPAESDISTGSPHYAAPEIFLTAAKPYTAKIDVWALGVLMVFLITNNYPFFYVNHQCFNNKISFRNEVVDHLGKAWTIDFSKHLQGCSASKKKLLKIAARCLHGDFKKRPSAKQIAVDLQKIVG